MLTSARIRSGFEDLAAWSAALPSSTVVSFTSSRANVMLTACWMVLESSARSRFLGMRARPSGHFNVYKVRRAEASLPTVGFWRSRLQASNAEHAKHAEFGFRKKKPRRALRARRLNENVLVVQVVAAAVVHAAHAAHSRHAAHS